MLIRRRHSSALRTSPTAIAIAAAVSTASLHAAAQEAPTQTVEIKGVRSSNARTIATKRDACLLYTSPSPQDRG